MENGTFLDSTMPTQHPPLFQQVYPEIDPWEHPCWAGKMRPPSQQGLSGIIKKFDTH